MFETIMMTFKITRRNWRWPWHVYVCRFSQGITETPFKRDWWFWCHSVSNLSRYRWAKNCFNIQRFGKVIAKIKLCSFFASQCISHVPRDCVVFLLNVDCLSIFCYVRCVLHQARYTLSLLIFRLYISKRNAEIVLQSMQSQKRDTVVSVSRHCTALRGCVTATVTRWRHKSVRVGVACHC